MKPSDSHLHFTWKLAVTLDVPIRHPRVAGIATRVLIATCVLTLALGLAAGLLLAVKSTGSCLAFFR